jgi:DNA repair exonuclease SbcCD ATPase subunit
MDSQRRMESVKDVKQALTARSRTATLEQLRDEGRSKVRVIKAEHIAALINEAVAKAIERTGLIPKGEAEGLVEQSRREFKSLLQERESELQRASEVEELLREKEQELQRLSGELQDAQAALKQIEQARAKTGTGGFAAVAGTAVTPDLAAALDKLAGSLNDRLESIGKKVGISAAVEGGEVDYAGLFKHADKDIESNIENIQVKQRAGGGIAANLARLKKLKGGG